MLKGILSFSSLIFFFFFFFWCLFFFQFGWTSPSIGCQGNTKTPLACALIVLRPSGKERTSIMY